MRILLLLLAAAAATMAAPVDEETARAVAIARMDRVCPAVGCSISDCTRVDAVTGGGLLAYAFSFSPAGYVVVPADDALPPVVAYSIDGSLTGPEGSFGILELVRLDLEKRLAFSGSIPRPAAETNCRLWDAYLTGDFAAVPLMPLDQWPPAGTTPTGGWLEENWTQGAPYNSYCPMDNIAGSRSAAGCPAVAMGMIVDNLETAMSVYFTDADDYYHNYHEYYYIDDDYIGHDFPSWPELNGLIDTLEDHYESSTPLTDSDKAALVVACGFACKQVFTASVSGTFGIGQAYDAYVRFGFSGCELLYESSDSLFEKLSWNMICANCAHMGIIDEGPTYGHNVVLDGYNTDDFYHLNFGWGGSYNGWYQFPLTGMPYGMNIIEGVVLNIGMGMTGIEEAPGVQGGLLRLSALANPSSGSFPIILEAAGSGHVRVEVFGIDGRLVDVLLDSETGPGSTSLTWDPAASPSGIYLVLASLDGAQSTARLTLLR
jgi:hypothetical protein